MESDTPMTDAMSWTTRMEIDHPISGFSVRDEVVVSAEFAGQLERELSKKIGELAAMKEQLRLANIDQCNTEAELAAAIKERDEARALAKTIAYDVSVLSTRPATIIKISDLVDLINEWGDAARSILDKKENTNGL